jgi:hypothetical protein
MAGPELKPDFESTTAVLVRRAPGLAWLPAVMRKNFTPRALWTAITILAGGVAYVGNALHDIPRQQESIVDLKAERQRDRELLEKIDTQLAVVNSRVGDIVLEVDRQREWRERIEDVAEAPPHAHVQRRLGGEVRH